jgi:hypothetical protein
LGDDQPQSPAAQLMGGELQLAAAGARLPVADAIGSRSADSFVMSVDIGYSRGLWEDDSHIGAFHWEGRGSLAKGSRTSLFNAQGFAGDKKGAGFEK